MSNRPSFRRQRTPPKTVSHPLRVSGSWRFDLFGPDGALKESREEENLIVNGGLDLIVDYLFHACNPTDQPAGPCYIAVGTSSTTVAPTDTDLGSELERMEFEAITAGGTGVVTVESTFPAGFATGAIAEAGIFTESGTDSGTMLNRLTFAAVNKGEADSLKVTFTFTVANAE